MIVGTRAYVNPAGSFADWVGKPYLGGLGAGDGIVAVVLTVLIGAFVIFLSRDGSRRVRLS